MTLLLRRPGAVGLGVDEIDQALEDGSYLDELIEQTERAIGVGAGGVPAWVIDERVLVPGAQPHEVFEQVMERLGHLRADGGWRVREEAQLRRLTATVRSWVTREPVFGLNVTVTWTFSF